MKPLTRCSFAAVEQLRAFYNPWSCRYLPISAKRCSSFKAGDRQHGNGRKYASFDEFIALHRSSAMRSAVIVYPEECRGELSLNVSSKSQVNLESFNGNQETHLVEFNDAADLHKFLEKVCPRFQSRVIPVRNRVVKYLSRGRSDDPHFPQPQALAVEKIDYGVVNKALLEADTLEDQIYELYERTKLSEVGLKIRFFLASAIEEIFRPFFPSAICKPFGSSVNGFGRRGCDLDVDIQLYNEPYLDVHATKSNGQFFYCCKQKPKESRHFVQNTLSTIGDVLNEFMPCYGDVQKILRARVPIIKFNHGIFGLSCDMTVENKSGYKAAKALWNVCQLHPSIGPMLFFIRHWAKEVGITHETPGIWLTNFQIICLLIFFLQRHSPSLLPSLDRLEKRMTLPPSSPSPEVFQLIQEFFYFYAHQVDYRKYGLDLNTGTLVEKKDSSLLYIRNPYESGHNITRNLSSDEWLNTLLSMDTALRLCEKADAMCRRRGSRNGDWGLLTLCNPVFYQERKKPSIASAAEEVAQSFSVEDVLSPDATETATAVPTNASSRIAASMNNLQKANLC